jgi:hypothetical protein
VVRCAVAVFEMRADRAVLRSPPSNLSQPDGGFDRLDLAEERLNSGKFMSPPIGQKPCRRRRDAPIGGAWKGAPARDVITDFVDDRGRIVLLLSFGRIVPVAKRERALTGARARQGNRRDNLGSASPFDRRHVQRLAVLIQRGETRCLVRAVQYRLFENDEVIPSLTVPLAASRQANQAFADSH